ncbi:MAG: hypothetical protein Q9M91_04205 [Candidatus Dojkabacteria bacterium]|nr:hypothetical protein [Candidatus Dojkabacteria bacterium]
MDTNKKLILVERVETFFILQAIVLVIMASLLFLVIVSPKPLSEKSSLNPSVQGISDTISNLEFKNEYSYISHNTNEYSEFDKNIYHINITPNQLLQSQYISDLVEITNLNTSEAKINLNLAIKGNLGYDLDLFIIDRGIEKLFIRFDFGSKKCRIITKTFRNSKYKNKNNFS